MIPVIFIALVIAWYLYQQMENKRKDRLEQQHEKKLEAYQNLLQLLKKKEEEDKSTNNPKK